MRRSVFSEVVAERVALDLSDFQLDEARSFVEKMVADSNANEFEGNTVAICFFPERDLVRIEDVFGVFETEELSTENFWSNFERIFSPEHD